MRRIILAAVPALGLVACDSGPKSLLTGGAWICEEPETKMTMRFAGDGKLTSDIDLIDPSPDGLHVKLKTGGSWELKGDSDLSFTFTDVAIAEAKRGDQALEAAEAEYFKGLFSDPDPVQAKIASITGNKLVMSQEGKPDLTCTR
jgi:hypothetical protein